MNRALVVVPSVVRMAFPLSGKDNVEHATEINKPIIFTYLIRKSYYHAYWNVRQEFHLSVLPIFVSLPIYILPLFESKAVNLSFLLPSILTYAKNRKIIVSIFRKNQPFLEFLISGIILVSVDSWPIAE